MIAKENAVSVSKGRGRPRGFDTQAALETGQRLFHARSYDAVGLAALTDALGVKPPSFYKAFGSKAAFFSQVLQRYAKSTLVLEDLLLPGRDPVEALALLLESAARLYTRHPQQRGCLVLEAARGQDEDDSAVLARRVAEERRKRIREFVACSHPQSASQITDFVASTLSGLSASAREGMSEARLLAVVEIAVAGLERWLSAAR